MPEFIAAAGVSTLLPPGERVVTREQIAAAGATAIAPRFDQPRTFVSASGVDWTPVYVPNVELLEVGMNWQLSTGPRTFTPADLAAAVAAQNDPAVHTPILKLGHKDIRAGFDPERDGTPSFGKAINLRTTNDGMTLVADFAGVPKWMADAMPTSWPTRSIEGKFGATTATGNTHPFVVTAVALLAEGPGIETLEDLPLALGLVAAADDETNTPRLTGRVEASTVMASVGYEEVQRAYYASISELANAYAWWIRELVIDPTELIVSDPDDGLWRIPYTIAGQEITFGEAEAVRVEYVAASASPNRDGVLVFASREESQMGRTEQGADPNVDLTELRRSLGLADTTPDDEVLRLAAARLAAPVAEATPDPAPAVEPPGATPAVAPAPPADPIAPVAPTPQVATPTAEVAPLVPTPTTPPVAVVEPPVATPVAPIQIPEGSVLIDATRLRQLEEGIAAGASASARLIRQDRDAYVGSVIAAGRMAPGNAQLRSVIEAAWNRNPSEADAIVQNLAPVFTTTEVGHAANGMEIAAGQADAQRSQDALLWAELAPTPGKVG